MPETKLQPWKCKNGHVMGHVKWKGHGQSELMLFREAVNFEIWQSQDQEIFALLEGYVTATVKCSVCAEIRTWIPGEEALTRLILSHRRLINNQVVQEE